MSETKYLTIDELRDVNRAVLKAIRVKKADQPGIRNLGNLRSTLKSVRETAGDIYDKAATMLEGLVRLHPFESGNRRTAYAATRIFLEANGEKVNVIYDAGVLMGVRESFYQRDEIKSWLKGNAIRRFERR